jgi:hypothetical protein
VYKDREDLSPLGYYNTSISFLDAGDLVSERSVSFDAPARALYAHAWELTLKACLRVQGQSIEEIRRKIGHDLVKAYDDVDVERFTELNLWEARFLMEQLNDFHLERLNFYPKAGAFNVLHLADVRDWSRRLRLDRPVAIRLFMSS